MKKLAWAAALAFVFFSLSFLSPGTARGADKTYIFGLLLVGPYNDHGWSQAHFEGGKYVEKMIPGVKMIYIDKVNPADRPGVTIPQLVDDMVAKGARLIIANSDDMKDGTREAARMHPQIHFLHISGDDVLTAKAPANLSNLMGRMEYGKMMAGFAAAMTTKTGKIGYLGPLVNEETRRLVVSCYLGAKYAWEKVLKKDPASLKFQVTWIGFWFNIPGVTADPTLVAVNFFNTGYDVVLSGIDTTEAVVVARQKRQEGKEVRAVPYDYVGACTGGADVCLGVPYFNWGPGYVDFVTASMAGKWKSKWVWLGPDWEDINDPDTSAVGFVTGPALSSSAKAALGTFIKDLGTGKAELFKGPLYYQDGSLFLKDGEVATDKQVWYMQQLLKGMGGQSSAK
ncbi:MAG: BMP family ABC transporter substrate-binding protein [Desulfobacterales bacterium]|uniref:BMP family ABC transporter substrate-binding protein n=1 Tax=Candidatus Desulfatibia profunda TaxID=2841695 RepID=A0A8J6NWQ1_9BACT|nr:BMP family ABC transporter substrate-binding protein [Candidatus Desulfatibia profunda]MBL7180184.1 BMP family ABC transporter substrate-binding protein [Desulfobacterales bacterium]